MEKTLCFKPKQAAEALGVSYPTMYELCKREDFPAIRVGRSILIPKVGLEQWLAQQSGKSVDGGR